LNELEFWNFAHQNLRQNKKITLLIVVEASNSSPGKQGFKLLINEDGITKGTIGGGIMENDMCDFALTNSQSAKKIKLKRLQHSVNTKLESSGLICGGFQSIAFISLEANDIKFIENAIRSIEKPKASLISVSQKSFKVEFDVDAEDDTITDCKFEFVRDDEWNYTEIIGKPDTVYIIGGGHVGKAVSDLMKSIGFHIIIFDHRHDVFTMSENASADKKIICNYIDVGNYIKEGNKSYIVICTPKHTGDKEALVSVLTKNVKYIGMMGSKTKIKTVFDTIKSLGYSDEALSKVHSPIGLEIFSETPNEIAVSIAAEIIKHKNQEKYVG